MSWPVRIATLSKGVGALRFTTSLPQSVSYSRTGAATALTSGGVIVPFVAAAPPITDRGLLLEPAATNLATQSQSLDNAAWTKLSGNTVTPNAATGPDGTAYLDKLVETNTTANQQIWRGATITPAGVFTGSIIAKAGERSEFRLQCEGGITNGPVAHFNLTTGVVSNTGLTGASAGASFISARMTPLANGCWLCEVTGTVGTADTAAYIHPMMIKAGSYIYAGNGSDGMYFGDGQIEMGSLATSRIVTTTAAVTRGLPSATVAVPAAKTVARVTYGLSSTVADITGLTPGATFDLVTGRAWVGLGNELKSLEWRP